MKRRATASLDLLGPVLSDVARVSVDAWTKGDQTALVELLRALPDDVHRELVQRAIAAGRGAEECLSFARALQPLGRAEAIAACTFKGSAATLDLRLRGASDPLFAFEANGKRPPQPSAARPGLPFSWGKHPGEPPSQERVPTQELELTPPADDEPSRSQSRPVLDPRLRASRSRSLGDDGGRSIRAPPRAGTELGESEETSFSRSRSEVALTEEAFNAALKPFGLQLQERPVDGPTLKLEQALERAAEVLGKGIPVPIALGREVGEFQRYAVIVQVWVSARSRAFQLYDPVVQELVWAHEADLLRRVELPFESKQFRRITAIALPRGGAR